MPEKFVQDFQISEKNSSTKLDICEKGIIIKISQNGLWLTEKLFSAIKVILGILSGTQCVSSYGVEL